MKAVIFTIWMLALPILAQGQEKEYPYPLKPGERFRGSAEVDSLFWVLKSSQYNKAISDLENYKTSVDLLETKAGKLEEIIANKDSTISDFKIEKDRLVKKWEETHMKLEDSEVKVLKLKRWTLFSGLIGIGAGVVLGALVF